MSSTRDLSYFSDLAVKNLRVSVKEIKAQHGVS